jgi:hypothetical protein
MSSRTTHLGRCPCCETAIPRTRRLIAYETDDGRAVYAECPGCHDVVHPV